MLLSLEINTSNTPTATIIWLHGLGADGNDFAPVVEAMQPLPHIRFVLPHAPVMPVTLNGGYLMPAWYDIYGLAAHERQDEAGINATRRAIEALIEQEIARGIAPGRIALAGFSQGGAVALHCGLRYPQRLAGVIALSTYLPLKEALAAECSAANLDIPILMAHGRFDDIIPLARAQGSRETLAAAGYAPQWHEYAMAHSVCNEEIADIRAFILEILPPQAAG